MRGARGMIVVLGVKVPMPERAGPRGSVAYKPELDLRYGTALVGREN